MIARRGRLVAVGEVNDGSLIAEMVVGDSDEPREMGPPVGCKAGLYILVVFEMSYHA